MSNENDAFLSNECMKAIKELVIKNPNDMDLGRAIRKFVLPTKSNSIITNQLTIDFDNTPTDMGDVNEY